MGCLVTRTGPGKGSNKGRRGLAARSGPLEGAPRAGADSNGGKRRPFKRAF